MPLFELRGLRARTGAAMDDLSVLMLYVVADKYLGKNGELGFVITQSVFKTEGGGEGFRRFKIGDDQPLRITQVDDFSKIQCFEGATNRTALVILQKGHPTTYPVPYKFWRKASREGIPTDADYDEAMSRLTHASWVARPVNDAKRTSPWLTGRRKALSHLTNVIGHSDYVGRYGSHTHLNGVYWVEIVTTRKDGSILISNLHDCGKRKVKNVNVVIEPDFLFPLIRGRDVARWSAKPSCFILLPQDPSDPAKGLPQRQMERSFPKTLSFFRQFEEELRNRSGFRQFFDPNISPFYSVYNVGPYTFSEHKVCWREVAPDLSAAVCSSLDNKVATFDHNLGGVFLSVRRRGALHLRFAQFCSGKFCCPRICNVTSQSCDPKEHQN
ncbi:MAG: hypothetical protein WBW81_13005 [Methylocella sp.]